VIGVLQIFLLDQWKQSVIIHFRVASTYFRLDLDDGFLSNENDITKNKIFKLGILKAKEPMSVG